MKEKKQVNVSTFVCTAISLLVAWLIYRSWLPAVNLRNGQLYGYLVVACICVAAIFWIRDMVKGEGDYDFEGVSRVLILVTVGVTVISLILLIINSKMITAKTLQKIPEIKDGEFVEDYVEISDDPAEVFTLDLDSAERLGDRAIGNIENASWYEVNNEFNLITYNGKKYRLSPLEYGGMFKYLKAKHDGIPGYVLVDDDTMEATFVKTEQPIRYSPSAFFGYNLERHLRYQFLTYIFSDSIFEIDEEGVPYWVTGITTPHASLYRGRVIEKVIVTNAYTGESTVYFLNEVPEWIDHVYPLNYLMNLAMWHYEYVRGYWNSVFSKTGIYRTSYVYRTLRDDKDDETANFYGYNSFVSKAGDTVFVTGITPANKSESNTGFLTLNARTGEMVYYPAEGAEESSAQKACESKMQNFGYRATYPVFVNVSGQPTYLMALKDKAGIIQAYGFVNLKNYSIACVNEKINIALEEYKRAIGLDTEVKVTEDDVLEVTGTVEEIYSQAIDGTTYYYYVVDGNLYKASAAVNELQFLIKVGDEIEIKYQEAAVCRNVKEINTK